MEASLAATNSSPLKRREFASNRFGTKFPRDVARLVCQYIGPVMMESQTHEFEESGYSTTNSILQILQTVTGPRLLWTGQEPGCRPPGACGALTSWLCGPKLNPALVSWSPTIFPTQSEQRVRGLDLVAPISSLLVLKDASILVSCNGVLTHWRQDEDGFALVNRRNIITSVNKMIQLSSDRVLVFVERRQIFIWNIIVMAPVYVSYQRDILDVVKVSPSMVAILTRRQVDLVNFRKGGHMCALHATGRHFISLASLGTGWFSVISDSREEICSWVLFEGSISCIFSQFDLIDAEFEKTQFMSIAAFRRTTGQECVALICMGGHQVILEMTESRLKLSQELNAIKHSKPRAIIRRLSNTRLVSHNHNRLKLYIWNTSGPTVILECVLEHPTSAITNVVELQDGRLVSKLQQGGVATWTTDPLHLISCLTS